MAKSISHFPLEAGVAAIHHQDVNLMFLPRGLDLLFSTQLPKSIGFHFHPFHYRVLVTTARANSISPCKSHGVMLVLMGIVIVEVRTVAFKEDITTEG